MVVFLLLAVVVQQNEHPRPELFARPAGVAVNLLAVGSSADALRTLGSVGFPGTRLAAFGEEAEPADRVFGQITGAILDQRGRIVLLDESAGNLRVISGRDTIYPVGRPGRGPGELYYPRSIAVDRLGRILIGEVGRRVHLFAFGPSRLRHQRSFTVPFEPRGICLLGDRLYLHGVSPDVDGLIHEVDSTGRLLRSFGSVYRTDNFLLKHHLSSGSIACDQVTGTVALATTGVGAIHAYSADGVPRWIAVLPAYRFMRITETANGTSMSPPDGGWHRIHPLTALPDGRLLVQVAHQHRPGRPGFEIVSLTSWVIDARTGAGRFADTTLPLIAHVTADRYVAYTHDPYPQVELWSMGPRVR